MSKLKQVFEKLTQSEHETLAVRKLCQQMANLMAEDASSEERRPLEQLSIWMLGELYKQQLCPAPRTEFMKILKSCVFSAEISGAPNEFILFQEAGRTLLSLIEQKRLSTSQAKRAHKIQRKWFQDLDAIFREADNA